MHRSAIRVLSAGILVASFGLGSASLWAAETPESNEATKEEAPKKPYWDKPEVYGEPLVLGNGTSGSSVYLGAGLSFGQARSTDGGSPGVVFLGKVEPGYQFKTGSWSRLELGAELFSGLASYSNPKDMGGKSTLPIGFGVLAKAGYGYSLGSSMIGVAKIGVGPVLAKYRGSIEKAGVDTDVTSETMTGLAYQLAYTIVMPLSGSLDFTGGISYTHMQFDPGKVKMDNGDKIDFDPINVNLPQGEIGIRIRL